MAIRNRFRRLQEAIWRAIDRGLSDRLERDGDCASANMPGTAVHEVAWIDEGRRTEVPRPLDRLREIADEGCRARHGELRQLDLVLWQRGSAAAPDTSEHATARLSNGLGG